MTAMSKTKNIDKIVASMRSFDRDSYRKDEVLPELLKLQREVVDMVVVDSDQDNADLRIWDVEKVLEQANAHLGGVADTELLRFKANCKSLSQAISGEISGIRGERRAHRSLATLNVENRLMKNVALSQGDVRSEIDVLVITRKGCFIVEVKNTRKDIFIDRSGGYYRLSSEPVFDMNIGQKTRDREFLLKSALACTDFATVPIRSIVVFTNEGMTVKNEYERLEACYLCQLPYAIEECPGEDVLAAKEMDLLVAAVEGAEQTDEYPVKFDAIGFKESFAAAMVALQGAEEAAGEDWETQGVGLDPERGEKSDGTRSPRLFARWLAVAVFGALTAAAEAIGKKAA